MNDIRQAGCMALFGSKVFYEAKGYLTALQAESFHKELADSKARYEKHQRSCNIFNEPISLSGQTSERFGSSPSVGQYSIL
jgi:hypothetical protein